MTGVGTLQDLTLQDFIKKHIAVIEPLSREVSLVNWELQTRSSEEARNQAIELSSRLSKVYSNPQDFARLKAWSTAPIADPLLARQHALLLNQYQGHQMDEAVLEEIIALEIGIEDQFNNFRATLLSQNHPYGQQVSDNEIEDTLLTSRDSALRQEAWAASKVVGSMVIDRLLNLVRLRNREAKRLGFANYYAMSLQLQEMDETRLFALLDDLREQTEGIWQNFKTDLDARLAARFAISPDAVRPWHHANRFFQEPESGEADLDRYFADKDLSKLTSEFFDAIGLPVDDLLERADLFERPGKCQHAFCMDVDKRGDVRVLCNIRSNERWMSTMLHEFGHAVYDKFNDSKLPYLLREPAHILTTEAIALFMGRLTRDARWLERYADVPTDEVAQIALPAQREVRNHLLVFMRWCFVMAHFERALYQDPDQDLDALWWLLVEDIQLLKCPPDSRPPHAWAAKIHLATSPVYYHNYLLGEMAASQLLHHINTVVLKGEAPEALVTSPKVGAYLREKVFYPGAIRPWEEWLQNAAGEPLVPAYFVNQLA